MKMKSKQDVFEALSELSKLGKKTKEVELNELKIELSTLNAEDESATFVASADLTGSAYFAKIKSETLKYSIKAVNGIRLDEYELFKEVDKREKMKKETLDTLTKILGSWDENVITFLYSKWAELSKESEEDLRSKGLVE